MNILICILITIGYCLVLLLNNIPTLAVLSSIGITGGYWTISFIYALLMVIYSVAVIIVGKKSSLFRIQKKTVRIDILVSCIFIAVEGIILFIIQIWGKGPFHLYCGIGEAVLAVLSVWFMALTEEFIFRGLFHELLQKYEKRIKGTVLTVVFAGICFGLMHIVNLVNAGVGKADVIVQIVLAIVMGIFYYTIIMSTGNVFLTAAIHFVYNAAQMLPDIFIKNDNIGDTVGKSGNTDITLLLVHCTLIILMSGIHIVLNSKLNKE